MEANLKGFVCYTVNHENKRICSLREKKEEKKEEKERFYSLSPRKRRAGCAIQTQAIHLYYTDNLKYLPIYLSIPIY